MLQITSDIASGAKHFQALASQHDSVRDLENVFGFYPQSFSPRSFSPASFQMAGLNITLNDGDVIHAMTLADDALNFWTNVLDS